MLKIYIADDCPSCQETRRLIVIATNRYANLKIDLINLSDPDTICPETVFAVPTFVHNDRVIFLGNPSLQELDAHFGEVKVS